MSSACPDAGQVDVVYHDQTSRHASRATTPWMGILIWLHHVVYAAAQGGDSRKAGETLGIEATERATTAGV